ncbi:MAG TPA: SulP family inorganic anion transporter, partial [Parafilimonas sp.]|nr:SulP family inorganic anion transporter [Parafilimonas sp.]
MRRTIRYYRIIWLKYDLPAGLSVFLVALPLCLGIALASGAPLYAGLLSGMIGGLVVSFISGSQLAVSGPAAGLTTVVAASLVSLGDYRLFLLAVIVAGLLQVILGLLKLGAVAYYFPSAVIKGMLAAIGIILISKQIPIALGYDQPDFWTSGFVQLFS